MAIGAGGCSSGGVAVAGILNYLSASTEPLVSLGLLYFHRLAESFMHTFAIRLSLADPSFVNTTAATQALLSSSYMSALFRNSSDKRVLPFNAYGGKFNAKSSLGTDHGTSHISIIDRHGNAVSMTTTVNTYFGSKIVSSSTGILLNDQMDDFSIPNSSNYFGLAPSKLNFPLPFKRPLSSMSPTIILDDSKPLGRL